MAAKQYNMYNVQLSEFWKQRVGRENVHNAPIPLGADGEPEDDAMSSYSELRAPSEISRVSTVTQQKINELEAKLDEEKRRARAFPPLLSTPWQQPLSPAGARSHAPSPHATPRRRALRAA